jgi:hypothetical protein
MSRRARQDVETLAPGKERDGLIEKIREIEATLELGQFCGLKATVACRPPQGIAVVDQSTKGDGSVFAGTMMKQSDVFRQNADNCLQLAEGAKSDPARSNGLGAWRRRGARLLKSRTGSMANIGERYEVMDLT